MREHTNITIRRLLHEADEAFRDLFRRALKTGDTVDWERYERALMHSDKLARALISKASRADLSNLTFIDNLLREAGDQYHVYLNIKTERPEGAQPSGTGNLTIHVSAAIPLDTDAYGSRWFRVTDIFREREWGSGQLVGYVIPKRSTGDNVITNVLRRLPIRLDSVLADADVSNHRFYITPSFGVQ